MPKGFRCTRHRVKYFFFDSDYTSSTCISSNQLGACTLDDEARSLHFLLSCYEGGVCVGHTPILKMVGDDATTVDQLRKKAKWDNDDYVCREAKYMAEDASSKKFLVSNFTNYKMTDSRPVMEQYNELLGILGRFTQHKMNMDEAIQVSCIIDKLPPSWKDFKHTLKHIKEELTIVELGSNLRIEESLIAQDSDKPNGNNVVGAQ
ncbi:hypothetical protein Tco_0806519 [Tanacetum coccineum]